MRRLKVLSATLVAVAMLSFGSAACSPEQQAQAPKAFGDLIGWVFTAFVLTYLVPPYHCPNNVC